VCSSKTKSTCLPMHIRRLLCVRYDLATFQICQSTFPSAVQVLERITKNHVFVPRVQRM